MSDGLRLAGELYLPRRSPDGPRPAAVVVCTGWGGTKRGMAKLAPELTRAGLAVLTFDYRGYGESEGRRARLMPHEQTLDTLAAAAFLRGDERLDPARIGVLGLLTGAAAALVAASVDRRIASVAAFFPFGDGERWLASLRPYHQWDELMSWLEADRLRRSRGGEVELHDPGEILVRDPVSQSEEDGRRASDPTRSSWRLGWDSADAIMAFKPEDHVHRIAGRPVLVVAAENDLMMPLPEVEALFRRLDDPKRLIVLRGIGHSAVFADGRLGDLLREVAAFLNDGFSSTGSRDVIRDARRPRDV